MLSSVLMLTNSFLLSCLSGILFIALQIKTYEESQKQNLEYLFILLCGANDLTIGWQKLNLLSHPNATLAPQARQARPIRDS